MKSGRVCKFKRGALINASWTSRVQLGPPQKIKKQLRLSHRTILTRETDGLINGLSFFEVLPYFRLIAPKDNGPAA